MSSDDSFFFSFFFAFGGLEQAAGEGASQLSLGVGEREVGK